MTLKDELAGRNGSSVSRVPTDRDNEYWSPYGDEPAPPEPIRPVSIGELIDQYPTLRPPLIEGLIRRGETGNFVAPSKAGKSWLAVATALSIVTGRKWLDRFQCSPGRVLLIDNELHKETIGHRIPVVAEAMGIRSIEYRDTLDAISLRGNLLDIHGIGLRIVDHIEPGQYAACIIDAWYRVLPHGTSENANEDMTALYNVLDRFADQTAAAWLVVTHSSKGIQSDKRVTDVGAGAGSQSRAADTHLVLREHADDGAVVLDAAVRSWPPVEPLALRWTFPVWTLAEDLDPASLKRQPTRQDERQAARDAEGVRLIVDAILKHGPSTARALRATTGISVDRLERLLAGLVLDGSMRSESTNRKGNPTWQYSLPD